MKSDMTKRGPLEIAIVALVAMIVIGQFSPMLGWDTMQAMRNI